jgi:hypothetical protein
MEEERPFKSSRRFSREKALEAFREIAPHKREYLLEAKAYRSTIQYASVWRQWKKWREGQGLPLMPATPVACPATRRWTRRHASVGSRPMP